jgi:hypothetical protein
MKFGITKLSYKFELVLHRPLKAVPKNVGLALPIYYFKSMATGNSV